MRRLRDVICAACLALVCADWLQDEDSVHYYLIIDAGSSGSRLRMYTGVGGSLTPLTPRPEDVEDFETDPGLSDYADNPSEAGPSLRVLLQAAKRYIPEEAQASSHLWVKATAGMRIVDPTILRLVFDAVDKYLLDHADNPFRFVASEVLGGEEEAVFAFLSVNHALGRVTARCDNCVGVMDMGGASMQIAYRPLVGDILGNEFSYYIHRQRQSVYAKSYIRFGIEQALKRLQRHVVDSELDRWLITETDGSSYISFPCFNPGYSEVSEIHGRMVNFTGIGGSEACERLSHELLHSDYECLLEPCPMMGVHMSPVDGLNFYAISGFFYITAGLGLVGWNDAKVVTPRQILEGVRAMCRRDKEEALAHSGAPWKYLRHFCFGGHYIRRVLLAFGFHEDSRAVTFVRQMPNGEIADWTKGAALFETQYMPMWLSSRSGPCSTPMASSDALSPYAAGKWQAAVRPVPSGPGHALVGGLPGVLEKLRALAGLACLGLVAAVALAAVVYLARTSSVRPRWIPLPLNAECGSTHRGNHGVQALDSPLRSALHGGPKRSAVALLQDQELSGGQSVHASGVC